MSFSSALAREIFYFNDDCTEAYAFGRGFTAMPINPIDALSAMRRWYEETSQISLAAITARNAQSASCALNKISRHDDCAAISSTLNAPTSLGGRHGNVRMFASPHRRKMARTRPSHEASAIDISPHHYLDYIVRILAFTCGDEARGR